jgi:hypothetical protein
MSAHLLKTTKPVSDRGKSWVHGLLESIEMTKWVLPLFYESGNYIDL